MGMVGVCQSQWGRVIEQDANRWCIANILIIKLLRWRDIVFYDPVSCKFLIHSGTAPYHPPLPPSATTLRYHSLLLPSAATSYHSSSIYLNLFSALSTTILDLSKSLKLSRELKFFLIILGSTLTYFVSSLYAVV